VALREKPATQREIIDQLWYCIIGTNNDGLIDRVKHLEQRPRSRWLLIKDLCLVGAVVVTLLFGEGILTVIKGAVR